MVDTNDYNHDYLVKCAEAFEPGGIVERMKEAIDELLHSAVILSEEYLESVSHGKPDSYTVQGWDRGRWKRALAASRKVKSLLSELEAENVQKP